MPRKDASPTSGARARLTVRPSAVDHGFIQLGEPILMDRDDLPILASKIKRMVARTFDANGVFIGAVDLELTIRPDRSGRPPVDLTRLLRSSVRIVAEQIARSLTPGDGVPMLHLRVEALVAPGESAPEKTASISSLQSSRRRAPTAAVQPLTGGVPPP